MRGLPLKYSMMFLAASSTIPGAVKQGWKSSEWPLGRWRSVAPAVGSGKNSGWCLRVRLGREEVDEVVVEVQASEEALAAGPGLVGGLRGDGDDLHEGGLIPDPRVAGQDEVLALRHVVPHLVWGKSQRMADEALEELVRAEFGSVGGRPGD